MDATIASVLCKKKPSCICSGHSELGYCCFSLPGKGNSLFVRNTHSGFECCGFFHFTWVARPLHLRLTECRARTSGVSKLVTLRCAVDCLQCYCLHVTIDNVLQLLLPTATLNQEEFLPEVVKLVYPWEPHRPQFS